MIRCVHAARIEHGLCAQCNEPLVPGLRISIAEVQRAAEYLKGKGWGGVLTFDEAIKALAEDNESSIWGGE